MQAWSHRRGLCYFVFISFSFVLMTGEWPRFGECTQWKIGRGDRITQSKNMVVKEAYKESNDSRVWEVNINRNLNDWEIQEYEALLHLLDSKQLNNELGQVLWKLNQRKIFCQVLLRPY